MSTEPLLPVRFRLREPPLVPSAVVALGPGALALARRLLELEPGALSELRGVAGPGLLLVLGDAALLPWVDGASYLGRDPGAPSLLLPTLLQPEAPAELLERALLGDRAPPVAVLPGAGLLCSAASARPISRERLESWLLQAQEGG